MSKKDNQPRDIKIDIDLKKIYLIAMGAGIVLSSLIVSGYFIYSEIKSISNSWNEIQFAKDNPEIVKSVMEDYDQKISEIKLAYTQDKQVAEVSKE